MIYGTGAAGFYAGCVMVMESWNPRFGRTSGITWSNFWGEKSRLDMRGLEVRAVRYWRRDGRALSPHCPRPRGTAGCGQGPVWAAGGQERGQGPVLN